MNATKSPASLASPDLTAALAEIIRGVSARARTLTIRDDSRLLEDLGLDSLDLVAVVVQIQDQFGVEIDPDELPVLQTVADLAANLHRQARSAA